MDIIKEKWINKKYECTKIIIRSNCYCSSFSHFEKLKAELDKDFPKNTFDPEIVQYGGIRYKRTFGIEVMLSTKHSIHTIPEVYEELSKPEYTL